MPLEENLKNRKWLLERIRAEVVGPDPAGDPVVPPEATQLAKVSWDEFRKPRRQTDGEEVLWQDPPTKRYGAGILYPAGMLQAEEAGNLGNGDESAKEPPIREPEVDEKLLSENERLGGRSAKADDSEDYDVTLANAFRPSAIGLSFLADLEREREGFRVELVSVGRLGAEDFSQTPTAIYRKVVQKVGDIEGKEFDRTIWLRKRLVNGDGSLLSVTFRGDELQGTGGAPLRVRLPGYEDIEVVVVSRPWGDPEFRHARRLMTVSLINRKEMDAGSVDGLCIFQAGLRISGLSSVNWIVPYPDHAPDALMHDVLSDEAVNRLLYRERQTYAIGHGCAADWAGMPLEGTGAIWSDVLPAFETPSTTAELEVVQPDGSIRKLRVSMRKLAGLDPEDDGFRELQELVEAYAKWIDGLECERTSVPRVPTALEPTARGLIERCRLCLDRIRDGLLLLREDSEVARFAQEAFRLANHAMLIAQLRTSSMVRVPVPGEEGKLCWTPPIASPDPTVADPTRGYWRPFQIAFLLMSLRGICDPRHADRDVVDLIWFPTGGGKTEAYLGLTAFTIFFNRLSGRVPGGVDVLMRYTLRLLTAQQFQRAALLFCAMEHLRRRNATLGEKAFRLGLWVGSATTPNKRSEAVRLLSLLEKDPTAENPFVLLKCPWCGARFGPRESGTAKSTGKSPSVTGYYRHRTGTSETVVYRCPDQACEFGKAPPLGKSRDPLPVVVIDEDLIEAPPNLLIGTVDKFAMLAWKPELRRFFGIENDGQHRHEPPSLIIQDELHLISGPLGTMVGAYEIIIDRLCREHGVGILGPKIVASTATISRASEQIAHLYARDSVLLFPPSGLEAGDSFFAKEDRHPDGSFKPGRLYIGVMAPGHVSLQTTQARVFASLMQNAAIMDTDAAGRDPWWTLLCFFNSLRELGSAATLFVADARDYLRVIIDRMGISYEKIRSPFATELTSRIRSDDIPKELARLELPYSAERLRSRDSSGSDRPVDVCLASNIIEVGVDIPRLSLMAVVGQPKTTSQYIQVSSRVGRDRDKPGLVAVLYGQSKPRDRSHYERFRSFHQRLYAQVEPTSVTPFSLPAVDRALHGVIAAAVRQLGELEREGIHPDPFPLAEGTQLREIVREMIRDRVRFVAPDEESTVMERLERRLNEWRAWNPAEYGGFGTLPEHPPLMHPAGATPPADWNGHSWPTLSSLRDVDSSCEAEITTWFNRAAEEPA
ncbi:MAG: helicase [Proteobacteria bacterium]|nr:helicase [Pseudomonadota bacterium]